MKKRFKKFLACLSAAVMIFSAASVPALAAQVKVNTTVSVKQEHKHKKAASVTPATLFKDGTVIVRCTECEKTLGKKINPENSKYKTQKEKF